jgi:hypothetical protein
MKIDDYEKELMELEEKGFDGCGQKHSSKKNCQVS